MARNRELILAGLGGVIAIGLLWLLPSIGLFIALAAIAFLPPWGRTYTERAIISILVTLGAIAIFFPRNSSVPIDPTTARLTFTLLIVLAVGLYAVPALRHTQFPRVHIADALILILFLGSTFWLVSVYLNLDSAQILSGLFISGWDNHGHFTPFANTYTAQQTAWATIDGSTAWNQWYPSVHSTTWTLAEMAADGASLSRAQLLGPYVQWSALSFTAAMATITWVASDLARRLSPKTYAPLAAVIAVLITGAFTLLGSPAFLFNLGFTNFAMGVALVLAASYLSTRSARSSVTLGWFLIPLAIIATIGLWTPLVLGLVPAGLIVLWRLWRHNKVAAAAWFAVNAIAGVVLVLTQTQAILGAEDGATVSDFNEVISAVDVGMAQFDVGVAVAAPLLALLFTILLIQRKNSTLIAGFAGPIGAGLILVAFFGSGALAADTSLLTSYYVLKVLNGMLLVIVAVIAAFIAVLLAFALTRLPISQRWPAGLALVVLLAVAFGFIGPVPDDRKSTFIAAPGIEAGVIRADGVENQLVGTAIMASVNAANEDPQLLTLTPVQWDASGTLVNLWLASLTETISVDQRKFYAGLPEFPYDQKALEYIAFSQTVNKDLDVAVYWFRPSSGELLQAAQSQFDSRDPARFRTVEVSVPPSDLCPECDAE